MKRSIPLLLALSLFGASAFAAPETYTVRSLDEKLSHVDIDRVASVKTLGHNNEKDLSVRVAIVDNGRSTDVSPRNRTILTLFRTGERQTTHTSFDLGSYFEVQEIARVKAGIYRLKVMSFNVNEDEGGIVPYTLTIDATRAFEDEQNLKLNEFDDRHFESSIQVTRQ